MEIGIILLAVGFFLLGGTALAAFFWAVRDGQLHDLPTGAQVIFDEKEPIGEVTDCFPDKRSREAVKQLMKS
jgi:cbb3-type cytochrome oxidase maturation protein